MDDVKRIGLKLRARREALNLTQYDVASKLGCTQSHISRIESGNNDRLSVHLMYTHLLTELEGEHNGKEEN